MSTSQTPNYGLNQWSPEDQFLREEFNADNARTDAALAALAAAAGEKAAQADLSALAAVVEGKAAQSALDSLKTTVDKKANQSALDSLTATVKGKANQSALDSLTQTVNTKAAQTALNSLTAAVNTKVDQAGVEAILAGHIVVGSYVAESGAARTISLGFTPKFVLLVGLKHNNNYKYPTLTIAFGPYTHQFVNGEELFETTDLQIVSGGFTVSGQWHGENGQEQRYLAVY